MLNIVLICVATVIHLTGTATYLLNTVRGKTQPNRVSWFLWSVVPMIAFAAALKTGAGIAAVPIFLAGFGPILVFCASFVNRNAYWKISSFDALCGIAAVCALILWGITRNAAVATSLAILGDFLAAIPTIIKAWKYPATENSAPFITALFSSVVSLIVLHGWTFSQFGFPVYIICCNTVVILCVERKRFAHFFGSRT